MSANACTRPPEGWWCSLDAGHDGPCPTHPYYGTPLEVVLAPYLSPEAIATVRAQLEGALTPEMAEKQRAAFERIRERNERLRRLSTHPSELESGA